MYNPYVGNDYFIVNPSLVIIGFLVILILGTWISSKALKNSLALSFGVSLIKACFFGAYYLVFFREDFCQRDSYAYMGTALEAKERILSEWHFLTDFLSFNLIETYGLMHHTFNAIITGLFLIFNSEDFIIPVTFNVIISFLTGLYLYKILIECKVKTHYARWMFIFFILNLEVLNYTTIALMKDMLSCFLTVLMFYFTILFVNKKFKLIHAIALLYAFVYFLFLRFYIPPLIIISLLFSFVISSFVKGVTVKKILLLFGGIIGTSMVLIASGYLEYVPLISYYFNLNLDTPYQIIRFFLTPIPYQVASHKAYYILPAIINWAFVPFTLFGIFYCLRSKNFLLHLCIYYIVIILFYATYIPHGDPSGPRHKIQIVFILSLFQFIGLIKVFFPKVKLLQAQ